MEDEHRKSIENSVEMIFNKAEAREKAGSEFFEAGWQATLEIMLLMMEKHLLENPGQLLPMQINGQDEWEFYLDVLEQLDLPPDTCAVLVTPSAFKDMPLPKASEIEQSGMAPWQRNSYSVIISDIGEHKVILQAALPGIEFAGIDVFEDGKHFADYMYNTVEECLDDLSNVTWTFFKSKGEWSKEQIIRYTENWYIKSVYDLDGTDVKFHSDFSYIHHPKLLNLTPLSAVFKAIQAIIPKEYESLDKSIEITNDLSRDMDIGEPVVTKSGILQDNQAECQAFLNRIILEIDMNWDALEYQKGVKMPDRSRKNPKYNQIFAETAKNIYKSITGRSCPKSLKVK
jgi:hypothetical protein